MKRTSIVLHADEIHQFINGIRDRIFRPVVPQPPELSSVITGAGGVWFWKNRNRSGTVGGKLGFQYDTRSPITIRGLYSGTRIRSKIVDVAVDGIHSVNADTAKAAGYRTLKDFRERWNEMFPRFPYSENPWAWEIHLEQVDPE